MEDKDPDLIDHDIYDEIANLEKWQDALADLIANNDITQEEYDRELLKSRYYLDIRTKNYVLEDEDAEILEKLRKYKASLEENYKMGIIDEAEFDNEFTNVLRKEYSILKLSESEEETKKQFIDIDEPLSEKLKKLHEAEIKYNKKVAKENKIEYPKLPSGIKAVEVDDYYNKKISNEILSINPKIEDYLKKLEETKKLIDYHTSSFEIMKLTYNQEFGKTMYEFKMIAPMSNVLTDIKMVSGRANLLTPDEQLYSDRQTTLKNKLRNIPREDLLKCIGVRTFKYMTYIEKLRENKQFVFKFRENPENYEVLKKILGEENEKYYKIESDYLFKDYTYSRPDIDSDKPSEFLQKGKINYLALKPGINKKDIGESLDNYVTVKPLDDPLYLEIKDKVGQQTSIGEVWELRTSLPGSDKKELVKRYLSFEDYLSDLKDNLIENSKKLKGKSKDILNERIRKISYYLKYSEDLENILPTGQIPLDKLFKDRNEIQKKRREGIFKLLNYITSYYPGAQVLSENTEQDIFNYSSSNYSANIDKLIFIFKNFSDKLEDFVERDESIVNLLTFETPTILPKDDIDLSDKGETIEKILKWKPNTNEYDNYSTELETLNYDFQIFKKNHLELSSLKIQEIMMQYSEKIQWDRSIRKYYNLEVPEGYIELNYRLRFLLKERNKLSSRRVYKVAKIDERIYNQKELSSIFKNCRIPDPDDYATLTEKIIISLSKTGTDYSYYSELIKTEYKKLCSFFSKLNLECQLDSDGFVKCIIKFEPKVLTPIITEFLITEGDFETADMERLRNLTNLMDSENFKKYIFSLRGETAKIYTETLINNKIYEKAIKILKSVAREERLRKVAEIANNIYKPPVVSMERPIKYRFGKEVTLDYIKIGDSYIYGGFYPVFYQYNDSGEIIKENYSRSDLEQLAIIFNLTIVDDSFELYKIIINFISEYNSENIQSERLNFSPVEYNPYYEYLKTEVKTINYTIRPRLGVPEPGEVYSVTKDPERQYGVPFDFNSDSIPIYSSELKKLVDDSFIIIEGPSIFVDTTEANKIISDNYILIEYLDSRGKPKLFREGVAKKKILRRKIDDLNTCSRFVNKETCDNPASFSLELNKLKFKCKWIENKCKGIIVEDPILKSFDLNQVKFQLDENNKLFNDAVNISIEYVETLVKERNSSSDEINVLAKEQKIRLYNYYIKLLEVDRPIIEKKLPVKDNFYSVVKDFEVLDKPLKKTIKTKNLETDYINYTIYTIKPVPLKLPLRRIVLEKEYVINSLNIIPKSFNEDGTVNCEVKDTGDTVILEKEQFRKQSNQIIMKTVPTFCYVHKDDAKYLKDFPGYFWYLVKEEYLVQKGEVVVKKEKEVKTFVPSNFIEFSKELNGRPLITKEDIFYAMSKTAFSEISTDDEFIYNITTKINIEEDAIDFAIKNRVDVLKMTETIVGNITLPMVLEEYEKLNPKIFISKTDLTEIINKAVEDKDKKTLQEYYVRARKAKLDKELLKEAKELIKNLKEPEKQVEPEIVKPVIETPQPVKSIYTTKRRR